MKCADKSCKFERNGVCSLENLSDFELVAHARGKVVLRIGGASDTLLNKLQKMRALFEKVKSEGSSKDEKKKCIFVTADRSYRIIIDPKTREIITITDKLSKKTKDIIREADAERKKRKKEEFSL